MTAQQIQYAEPLSLMGARPKYRNSHVLSHVVNLGFNVVDRATKICVCLIEIAIFLECTHFSLFLRVPFAE